ncbi:MAG: DsrE/DsrF/DrsH-like family protein [Candidatus Heimdallarchaeota archaeon]|nr:DsrE/DsrF/DrsH-like family protein [Candidatus Heimdallarchaeota archaeon]
MIDQLNIILKRATMDGFTGAAVMTSGAAALDIPVNIFLSHDAVFAFKKDQADKMLPVDTSFDEVKNAYMQAAQGGEMMSWYEMLKQAKELGDVTITACGLAMDIFKLTQDDLIDLVDEIGGVADFLGNSEPEDLTVSF